MSNVLKIIARGFRLPEEGWGFPPVVTRNYTPPSVRPEAVRLRRLLFPTQESEMYTQLVRWYYAALRSRPHIWRSLEGKYESYEPCGIYKPSLEADKYQVCPDPLSGFLRVGWKHQGETAGVAAALEITGEHSALLTFPDWSGAVPMSAVDGTDVQRIQWPEWMDTQAALIVPAEERSDGTRIYLRFRPRVFSPDKLLAVVLQTESQTLQNAGLLDSFLAAVKPLDKLAVVWLALAILEEDTDLQTREGDDA